MTTRNNSLAEIGRALIKAETVLIFPHILMDGDALGSSVALCRALRNSGKNCHVLIEDRVPGYISFLDKGYCTDDQAVLQEPADVCICVDCGEESRFPGRVQVYREGKTKICIDHHPTSMGIGDLNYIEQGAAATGELIYALLEEMNIELDKEIAEAIYTTIMTDTGNFRYSNTRKRSHEIVMNLYDKGIKSDEISNEIYENESLEKIKLQSKVISTLELFSEGKGAIAFLSQDMLRECGAKMEDSEGIVATLRSLRGVEIAAFIKEIEEGKIKVTMRAKTTGDVAQIAIKHNGGGHVKAAGCTIMGTIEEAKQIIKEEIEQVL